MNQKEKRFNPYGRYLRERFGCRVHKVSVDAGFTCPNRDGTISYKGCIYCQPRSFTPGLAAPGLSIKEQIERGQQALRRRYGAQKFIAYFQPYTNTYAPLERLKSIYDEAISCRDIVGISVATRPDCVQDPILDLLAYHSKKLLVAVEFGLQSANDETLRLINRGHSFAQFKDAAQRAKARGLEVCAHVIIGLPGESARDVIFTSESISSCGVDGAKLHALQVVKGAPLQELYESGGLRLLELGEYASRVADFLEYLSPGIFIHRLVSESAPGYLIAPTWSADKRAALAAIEEELKRRDSHQGKHAFEATAKAKS